MVKVPSTAVLFAEKETATVQLGVQGSLENVAKIPTGRLVEVTTKRRGLVGVPLTVVTVNEEDWLVEPWATVRLSGEGADTLKSKAIRTVRDMLAVFVTPPPTAWISTVEVPIVAVLLAANEMPSVHVGMQGLFTRFPIAPVTPVGSVEVIENVNGLGEPLIRVATIGRAREAIAVPWSNVTLLGAERLKSNEAALVTLRLTVLLLPRCVSSPA
jgi:hypothetical protein